MTAGSGGSPASPRLFARHRFPFRISLSRRDAPGLARGSWSFLCPLPTVNTRVRRPCSDLTAASSLPRASFPVPAAPRDAEPPSVVRAFVSGSRSPGSWPVRGPPGRARWGPAPCGVHRVVLAGVLARAGPTHAAVCWFPGLSPPGVWPPAAQPRGSYVFCRFCPKLSPEREACTATGPRAGAGRGFFIPVTGKGS